MDLSKVQNIIEKCVNEEGYSLYSFDAKKQGKDLVLSVVVDRVESISMNDIVALTDKLNAVLDENDPIEESYMLDLSSLGAEKPLKVNELSSYVGKYIHLHLINPIDGENIYEGTLSECLDDSLILSYRIKTREKKITVLFSNIKKVRLAIKF